MENKNLVKLTQEPYTMVYSIDCGFNTFEITVICKPSEFEEYQTQMDFWLGAKDEGILDYMFGVCQDTPPLENKEALKDMAVDFIVRNFEDYLHDYLELIKDLEELHS